MPRWTKNLSHAMFIYMNKVHSSMYSQLSISHPVSCTGSWIPFVVTGHTGMASNVGWKGRKGYLFILDTILHLKTVTYIERGKRNKYPWCCAGKGATCLLSTLLPGILRTTQRVVQELGGDSFL